MEKALQNTENSEYPTEKYNETHIWSNLRIKKTTPIEPPLEFQDIKPEKVSKHFANKFAKAFIEDVMKEALITSSEITWTIECSQECHPTAEKRNLAKSRLCWKPEVPIFKTNNSVNRLSTSHTVLSVQRCEVDDSSFITLAMSHELLVNKLKNSQITDIYNVPFDCDIYSVPIDTIQSREIPPKSEQQQQTKKKVKSNKKKKRHLTSSSEKNKALLFRHKSNLAASTGNLENCKCTDPVESTGPSLVGCSTSLEPIHMTLQEVRHYLKNLYSNSEESLEHRKEEEASDDKRCRPNSEPAMPASPPPSLNIAKIGKKSSFSYTKKNKKYKENTSKSDEKEKKCTGFSASLKETLCNIFRFRKMTSPDRLKSSAQTKVINKPPSLSSEFPFPNSTDQKKAPFTRRALPPLPAAVFDGEANKFVESPEELSMDFASSIEKVKDYGWYWGPISSETAEKILSSEPDGSFIVRDSSDHHYIFSLTFRLNGCIRHVRIEHDQGNFSFGSCTKFKSHTIVDFIENAVEHSRSGRYLFFLHRRPILGPMRVQLLHPVSRFKQVQSLQHMCRFVILKHVRRDLIPTLPLPHRMIDYLSMPYYYAEQQLEETPSETSVNSEVLAFLPHRPRS